MAQNGDVISGCIDGPGPNGEIITSKNNVVRPLTFLGGTVLSFTASLGIGPTEESSLDVELINDCKVSGIIPTEPEGEYFLGNIRIGSPAFFDVCEAMGLNPNDPDAECFKFGGFLQSYTAKQGSNGFTFSARVVDPRSLLANVTIVVGSTLSGPVRHRNYFNAYAYYESSILPPNRRWTQPGAGFTINRNPALPGGAGDTADPPIPIDGDPNIEDCTVFGSANSDERGMTYASIIHAINNMRPLVYSPNYGETFDPPLNNIEFAISQAEGSHLHQNNVFRLDLSGLPNPPQYLRAPGPSLTLLDLISTVCESTGHEFHVSLERNPIPFGIHTIKINTRKIGKVVQDFKSTIISYNGRSVDLSYGIELKTDAKTRTLLIGEQKHEMLESSNIEMYFGIDKNGDPIIPKREPEDEHERCGFYIEIYLDDLNHQLYCPLFDYEIKETKQVEVEDGNFEDQNVYIATDQIITRKVKLDEFTIRAAMSSFELWKKYVFNPIIDQDFCSLVQVNFPDAVDEARFKLLEELRLQQDRGPQNVAEPPDLVLEEARAFNKSVVDLLLNPNLKMAKNLIEKRNDAIKRVWEYVANIGRTYYGKQYLVTVSKNICATQEGLKDINYLSTDGVTEVEGTTTVFKDPCAPGKEINVENKIFRPEIYSHVPTNDGAWIEKCGSVLGLGDEPDGSEANYLDFFRTEDYRVGPFVRIDHKKLVKLRNNEVKIDESETTTPSQDSDKPPSARSTIVEDEAPADDDDFRQGLQEGKYFYEGVCGALDKNILSLEDYITIRENGICAPPTPDQDLENAIQTIDLPETIYVKCSVDERILIVSGECVEYTDTSPVYLPPTDPCCYKWQNDNKKAECYLDVDDDAIKLLNESCDEAKVQIPNNGTKIVCDNQVKIPIIFNAPLYQKPCDGLKEHEVFPVMLAILLKSLKSTQNAPLLWSDSTDPDTDEEDKEKIKTEIKANEIAIRKIKPSRILCKDIVKNNIDVAAAAIDAAQINNNNRLVPTALIPDLAAVPLKSNVEAYGPWVNRTFNTSSGGVEFKQDADISPWFFGSVAAMNNFVNQLIDEEQINLTELETGNVTYPYWPEIPLGFLDNGPNLTRINVSFGSNGVTSTYTFQSYTPQFAKVKTLEKEAIKNTIKNSNRLSKLAREKERKLDILKRKLISATNPPLIQKPGEGEITSGGTLHRVLVGSMYDFNAISDLGSEGYTIVGTGDRTVVGTETLEKSVLELRYDYEKKAFISLDGIYSPVSINGDGGFPRYAAYSGYDFSAESIYVSPNPPVRYSGDVINDLSINRHFSNPLTNNFEAEEHHHKTDGAGHVIDIVGREAEVPESGIVMNFYGQRNWDARYSDDYRFLGLKGPLVLHAWGYDTQGKPIPNAVDKISDVKAGQFATSGLEDYFLEDWLHKPSTWPVAPVDLRFDRERGVWVSPPQHKIVVVEASGTIDPYETGPGYLINKRESRQYGINIYDKDGNLIEAEDETDNLPSITIEDRIGRTISPGEKAYAYFDSFTSTYLLMAGTGSSIKIGKFCNQWPSLSNVKDPVNATKKVVLYEPADNCDPLPPNVTKCPWLLKPVTINIDGVETPKVIEAINIFSNVSAAEYQTKWCAVTQIGSYYYLLAAEC